MRPYRKRQLDSSYDGSSRIVTHTHREKCHGDANLTISSKHFVAHDHNLSKQAVCGLESNRFRSAGELGTVNTQFLCTLAPRLSLR